MIEYTQKVDYARKSSMSDIEYFKQVLADADKLHISVRWNFDEQQADPFHHNFNSHEFFNRLESLIHKRKRNAVE